MNMRASGVISSDSCGDLHRFAELRCMKARILSDVTPGYTPEDRSQWSDNENGVRRNGTAWILHPNHPFGLTWPREKHFSVQPHEKHFSVQYVSA